MFACFYETTVFRYVLHKCIYIYILLFFSRQVKERNAWVAQQEFPTTLSGTLIKQKTTILEWCCNRQVRHIEQRILDAVKFPDIVGEFRVVLDPDLSYAGIYNCNSEDEKVVKICSTLKKVHDWLIAMMCAYKKGSLSKQMQKTYTGVKEAAALTKVASALQEKSLNVDSITSSGSSPQLNLDTAETVDVTGNMFKFQKVHTVDLPLSQACIHKGSLNTFAKLAAKTPDMCAIMLGKLGWNKKHHVTNIVMSKTSVVELLEHERIQSYINIEKLEVYGILVRGSSSEWSSHTIEILKGASCTTASVLCGFDFSESIVGERWAIEVDFEEVEPVQKAVTPAWTTHSRDNKIQIVYNICWVHDLGTSYLQASTQRVCDALVGHVLGSVETKAQACQPKIHSKYHRHLVPADGFCGWHCLVASENFEKYKGISRQPNGYATAPRIRKEENERAKDFRDLVCQQALDECDEKFHRSINRVMNDPMFNPTDLAWISQSLGCSIRCTCCKEVGWLGFKLMFIQTVVFIYIDMYIYIYIRVYKRSSPICIYIYI